MWLGTLSGKRYFSWPSTAALEQRLAWRLAPSCILCCLAAVCLRIPADKHSYNLLLFLWHRHLVYIMFQRRSLCPSYFSSLDLVTRCCYKYGACPYVCWYLCQSVGAMQSFLCLLQIIKSVCRSQDYCDMTWCCGDASRGLLCLHWCCQWCASSACQMLLSCYDFGADISTLTWCFQLLLLSSYNLAHLFRLSFFHC